eukprot:2209531-Rhodomonas_salina.3
MAIGDGWEQNAEKKINKVGSDLTEYSTDTMARILRQLCEVEVSPPLLAHSSTVDPNPFKLDTKPLNTNPIVRSVTFRVGPGTLENSDTLCAAQRGPMMLKRTCFEIRADSEYLGGTQPVI